MGSEMCIRDRYAAGAKGLLNPGPETARFPFVSTETYFGTKNRVKMEVPMFTGALGSTCLLYTSDAADDLLCVDIGGRRILTQKKQNKKHIIQIMR